MGFKRMEVNEAKEIINEKSGRRQAHVEKLVESYKGNKALAFSNLESEYEKNPEKVGSMLLMLENTEKEAFNNSRLLQNAQKVALQESVGATGGSMSLILPQDIVKVARIAYTNSIAEDLFDVWGMESVSDSIFKLSTQYASSARGATAGSAMVESYGSGRYPTTIETVDVTTGATPSISDVVVPYSMKFINSAGKIIGTDNGQGGLILNGTLSTTVTINYGGQYGSGTTAVVTETTAGELYTAGVVAIEYAADFENDVSDDRTAIMGLEETAFRARLNPLKVEISRFTNEVVNSKLGLNGKDILIAGASGEFKKSFDERCIKEGIRAQLASAQSVSFDADWSTSGAVSSYDYAQNVVQAITNAKLKTYNALGRFADSVNMVVDSDVYAYLTKCNKFTHIESDSHVGMMKVGDLGGVGVYLAPDATLQESSKATGTGVAYVFGKSKEGMSVDSPISVGVYGTGITTPELEFSNFNTEFGLGSWDAIKIMNNKFATKIAFTNLDKN